MRTVLLHHAALAILPAALLSACGGGDDATVSTPTAQTLAASSTTTAQSVAIDTTGTDVNLAIVNTKKYEFNGGVAAGYFSNTLTDTVVTPSQTSSDASKVESVAAVVTAPCTPVPDALTAPAPDATVVYDNRPGKNDWVGKNKCQFLDGDPLPSTTYTRSATSTASCSYVSASVLQGGGKYKNTTTTLKVTDSYVWTYTVAPQNYDGQPFTAWELKGETNPDGTVPVNIKALIAGESVSISKNLGTKHSFSLLDNYGLPRVTAVSIGTDASNTVSVPYDPTGVDLRMTYVDQVLEPTLDFGYYAVAPNLFGNTTAQLSLVNGPSAKAILRGDAFWSADKPLGTALAAMRVGTAAPVALNLGAGLYTLSMVATVKDNTGTVLSPIKVDQALNIVTPGCGERPAN